MAELKKELTEDELMGTVGGADTMASLNRENSMQHRSGAKTGGVKTTTTPVNGVSAGVPMFCSKCGETFMVDGTKNHVKCPNCGKSYTICG